MNNYDTNIDNYNESELLELLKIDIPINLLTSIEVSEHLDIITSKLSNIHHESIIDLFTEASNKIKNKINLKKTYEIFSPEITVDSVPVLKDYALTSNNNIISNTIDSNNPVIISQNPSAINVNNTSYPQGIINPIEKKTIKKVINIDSIFRTNYDNTSSSNFMWDLFHTETNIVSMRISSVDIPIVWYSINDIMNRNEFTISLYNMQTGGVPVPDTTNTLIIPPGNYMSDNFTNTLNLLFKKQGGGLEYLIADIDDNTTKTIFRAMDKDDILADSTGLSTHAAYDPSNVYYAPNFYFELNFFPYITNYSPNNYLQQFQRTVGWYMGFREYYYTVVETDTVKQIIFDPYHNSIYYNCGIESESSYGSIRENYIFLSIDDYNRNSVCQPITSSIGNSYIGDNILARITVNDLHNNIVYDNGSDKIFKERVYMGPVTIEKLKINLINKYGEIINLNSNNFSFTLELTKLY